MPAFGRKRVTVVVAAVAAVAAAGGLSFAGQPRARTATSAAAQLQARTATSPPSCSSGTRVQTRSGPVCGRTSGGEKLYLDIPFAAPPAGKLRWKPPQPVKPWTATYKATQRGPGCLSPGYPTGSVEPGTSENCLFLEVQEPASIPRGKRLPVMFEIHGGGFLGEYRDDNGANLIRSGPVIYVYAAYRLGILGFLADKALGPHSGDYGLQDQQFALGWVKQNIAAFGGDPGNVTIFGESAGGASVCDQVASPAAKGLFRQGISVSGFYNVNVNTIWWPADCKSKLQTEAQAQKEGAAFAAKAGCGHAASVAACLRKVPADTLVEKAGQAEEPFAGGAIGPAVNGTTLPASPAEAFKRGQVNKVALMIGVSQNEFNGGVYTNLPGHTVVASTPAQYQQLVRQQFGPLAPAVMRLYPLQRFPSPAPFIAYRNIMADAFSVCPALVSDAQLARYIPVYAFQDDNADSPDTPPAPGETQPLGAYHSATNRLVHDPASALDPDQAALQAQVLAEWTGLARTGQPAVPYTPAWARYSTPGQPVMSLMPSGDSMMVPAGTIMQEHNCGFWDTASAAAPWAS